MPAEKNVCPASFGPRAAAFLVDRALLAAATCACEGYRAEDMFDLLKSGLTGVSREDADVLENYARAKGLRGAAWEKPCQDERAEAARQALLAAPLGAAEGADDA